MKRGEIRWVDLDPARDSEAAKVRPAVVVSNNTVRVPSPRCRSFIGVIFACQRITSAVASIDDQAQLPWIGLG